MFYSSLSDMFQNFNTNNQSKYSYDRVKSLRSLLKKKNLDGVIVPKVDRYQGEYIPLEEERLSWLTNFSGSAGMAIVSQNSAAIFHTASFFSRTLFNAPFAPRSIPDRFGSRLSRFRITL